MEKKLPRRRIDWYITDADVWQSFPDMPHTKAQKDFYLDADKGTLEEKAGSGQSVSYLYDPNDPVPSHGVESLFATSQEVGNLEQPGPNWRPDVVSFLSAPLGHSLTLLGEVQVELYVKSSAEDTAFTAKLMEVTPEGKAYNIRGSIATLAYDTPYTPGEVRKITVSMWAAAFQIQAGSRLRLDISSSDFPQYAVHPNLPGCWAENKETAVAEQTVLTGCCYPSRILLPTAASDGSLA